MVFAKEDQIVVEKLHLREGDGTVLVRSLMDLKHLNGYGKFFSILSMEPGSSIGWHVHIGESESFYVIKGTAEFNDNGTPRIIMAGDCAHTPSGEGHWLKNVGKDTLEVLALVVIS